ncbi:MAG: DegQ family serine endoprotease [Desulfuromonadales bacterium]|nr:DegQ family serine endoprotease [Desulfuromonadales bacterium]
MFTRFYALFAVTLLILGFVAPPTFAQDAGIASLRETGKAFRSVAKEVSPAVVFIRVEKEVKQRRMGADLFGGQQFGNEFFRHFFGEQPQLKQPKNAPRQRQSGQGSGFIISADGYIMTNNHVVGEADKVTVQLLDGSEYSAKIVGTDPPTDVALIKIDTDEDLPFLPLGNSDKLEVGDWVLAFGNPFGLSHTLTAGIVSAKGRSGIGITDYENFIQTDAAINPGNSGGPLVNIDGEVVGMNTAIFTRSGGYMGIGFAIPINMAKGIKQQLVNHGGVTRGQLGVMIQELTNELAESFGIGQRQGILISQVMPDSSADQAGLEQGDILLKLNGNEIGNIAEFRNQIAMTSPGTKVKFLVLRNGKKIKVNATIGTKAADTTDNPINSDELPELGMQLQKLTPELAKQFGYENSRGVLVTEVASGSIAARAGIKRGSLIEEVNRKEVNTPVQVKKLIMQGKKEIVLLLLRHGNSSRYIALKMEK